MSISKPGSFLRTISLSALTLSQFAQNEGNGLVVQAAEEVAVEDKWWNWGLCPHRPDPVGNLEIERYMGMWYQIRVDKDNEYMKGDDCVTTFYTYNPQDWWFRLFWLVTVNNGKFIRSEDRLTNWWMFGDIGKALNWTRGSARCDSQGNCNVMAFF